MAYTQNDFEEGGIIYVRGKKAICKGTDEYPLIFWAFEDDPDVEYHRSLKDDPDMFSVQPPKETETKEYESKEESEQPFDKWLEEKRKASKQWTWLEANNDVMNKYLESLGVPPNWKLHEIFGTDPSLLSMVPQPAVAVTLLFPWKSKGSTEVRQSKSKKPPSTDNVWHTYQFVRGACGSVGLLHAVMNNMEHIKPNPDGFYGKFFDKSKSMTPAERAQAMHDDPDIETGHKSAATAKGTSSLKSDANEGLHFSSFVHVDGGLYELDGLAQYPIHHGSTTLDTFLADACKVIRTQYMDKDPDEIRFNMMALSKDSSVSESNTTTTTTTSTTKGTAI